MILINIYTFNQYNRLRGNNISVGFIDKAMAIIPFNLCRNIKWKLDVYEADGYSIKECDDDNRDKHVYIDEDLYYCNKLAKTLKMLLTMVFCVCKSQRLYRARGSTLRV